MRIRSLLLLVLTVLVMTGCTLVEVNLGPKFAPFEERTIAGSGRAKVLLVDVSGVIFMGNESVPSTPLAKREDMVARLTEELELARSDKDIKALIVRIDSPGGTVSASDVLYHQIRQYREETGNKATAAMMGVATSGGYYTAVAADRIVALPTTVTGSIGVISLKLNISGLMDKYGVKAEAIKSAPLKDIWSPFRPANPEERKIMQNMIDRLFDRFKTVVRQGRPNMTADQFERAITARIFTADEALELGLIDKIGYPEDAFTEAKAMAGLEEARLVVYHRPGAYRPNFYSHAGISGVEAMDLFSMLERPSFMYLWAPGLN